MLHRPGTPPSSLVLLLGTLLCVAVAGCGPSDPLEEIRQRQAAGDFQGTIEPLRELLVENRDDGEVNYLYGRALALTGQTGLAEWSLRKAMEQPDWIVPAGLQLAYGELAWLNYASAIETTTRILEAAPDNIEARLVRANAYTQGRMHHEEALADVERVLELDPDNLEVMRPKTHALLGLDRIDEAAESLAEMGKRIDEARLGSDLPGWHCSTSAIFAEEGKEMELAAERWADCVERYPAHPKVVSNSILFYDGQGDYDRSLEILRAAYQELPESRQYRGMLAERLRTMGEAEEGEAVLRAGTESEVPQIAAAAWIDLAKLYQEDERWDDAADAAGESIALVRSIGEPPPQLAFEYADALVLAGRLDQAVEEAERLSIPAHREMILARVAQKRGDHVAALAHYDEAFRLWPDNPYARYYAALAAEALGDFDRAIEAYRYSIRISAPATDSGVRLAQLHLAEGRPRDALQMLFLNLTPGQLPSQEEGRLLAIELWARLGMQDPMRQALTSVAKLSPGSLDEAGARAARGLAARAGAAAAVELLRGAEQEGLDLTDPGQVEALEALALYSVDAGKGDEVEADLDAALKAHPEVAVFHSVQGLWRERSGADRAEIESAYRRALELDPKDTRALKGLGRLELESDPAKALELFQRATATDPGDADAVRGEALALIAASRNEEAEARLADLLAEHPYDADAATRLALLHLERGVATEVTLERARRAVRFGRSADEYALLSRVYQQRNEPELARRAAARSRELAEAQGG